MQIKWNEFILSKSYYRLLKWPTVYYESCRFYDLTVAMTTGIMQNFKYDQKH